jgi:paraquat-inducible protein A
MLEVILLGVMVALTKIAEYATVIPGHALFALGALVIVLASMQSSFDPREIWERVQWAHARDRSSTDRMLEATS